MKNVFLFNNLVSSALTSMDFDISKMIVALGYSDGMIEILKI
jgi:hypothetical protein